MESQTKLKILNHGTRKVLFEHTAHGNTMATTVAAAIKDGVCLKFAALAYTNLSGLDLNGVDLSFAYLSHADMQNVSAVGTNFEGALMFNTNLQGSQLSGANLREADLTNANLEYARIFNVRIHESALEGARLEDGSRIVGERPLLQIGPIGSRDSQLVAFITDKGVRINAGCFFGSIDKFKNRLIREHGDGVHTKEYLAALHLIETHAEIWTPAA